MTAPSAVRRLMKATRAWGSMKRLASNGRTVASPASAHIRTSTSDEDSRRAFSSRAAQEARYRHLRGPPRTAVRRRRRGARARCSLFTGRRCGRRRFGAREMWQVLVTDFLPNRRNRRAGVPHFHRVDGDVDADRAGYSVRLPFADTAVGVAAVSRNNPRCVCGRHCRNRSSTGRSSRLRGGRRRTCAHRGELPSAAPGHNPRCRSAAYQSQDRAVRRALGFGGMTIVGCG